jgi:hypothetical protein
MKQAQRVFGIRSSGEYLCVLVEKDVTLQLTVTGRNGSLAVILAQFSRTAAFRCIADVRTPNPGAIWIESESP